MNSQSEGYMEIKVGTKGLRGTIALLLLTVSISACGTEGDGETETASSDLLSNVAYLPWQTLTAKSGTVGGATLFGNKAYFAYIRSDSTIGIVIDTNLGGSGQSPTSYSLPEQAQFGTDLVALGGTLYLFYVDTNGTHLSMMTSQDGINWRGPYQLNGSVQWNTPPSAVAWEGQVLVYISNACESYEQCMYQANISGTSATYWGYAGPVGVPPATFGRATATVWKGALYLAWANSNQSGQIDILHYTDSAGWSGVTSTGKSGIPSLYPVGAGGLEMLYRSTDSHIYSAYTGDGVSFGASSENTGSTTNHAVIPFENWNLSANWFFFIGTDNKLYTALQ
jgi:hypothetical protein